MHPLYTSQLRFALDLLLRRAVLILQLTVERERVMLLRVPCDVSSVSQLGYGHHSCQLVKKMAFGSAGRSSHVKAA